VLAGIATVALVYSGQTLDNRRLEISARELAIYDDNEELIKGDLRGQTVKLESLNKHTIDSFISVEDKNFYKHKGISPGRIGKAAVRNIISGSAKEGASTITQQLVKNTHLTHEKTIQRKMREASLAIKLERQYSKDEILEMYLNVVYFGNGIYGLENAARFYFSKTANELGLKESAGLAGILKSPTRFCPINNYENFHNRANLVLMLMHEQEMISEKTYIILRGEKIIVSANKTQSHNAARSYKHAATIQAAQALDLSAADLASYGYKVFTYYDNEVQTAIFNSARIPDYQIKNVSGENSDSIVIMATPDGRVKGYYSTNPTLYSAKRNFASVMKPLFVYTPGIELGVVSPATNIIDEPFIDAGFNPKNFDGQYRGAVSVRDSIVHSHNIPAVKTLEYTGINRSVEIAHRIGAINKINSNQEDLSLALGNTQNGTTFWEVISGYSTLANRGERTTPSLIKRIEDRDGKVVWKHINPSISVIGEDTAFLVTDMLRDTAKFGTAKKLSTLGFPVAAKTGTCERAGSTNNTDAVICAYTDNCVLLVWRGNASMKPEHDLPKGVTGGGLTTFVARDILRRVNIRFEPIDESQSIFNAPSIVTQTNYDLVDAQSGIIRLAHENTPNKDIGSDLFSRRFMPTEPSARFLKPTIPNLDGKISDTGVPLIWFDTHPSEVYEIYKKERDAQKAILMEVIKGKQGEYMMYDKTAKVGSSAEYFVKSKIASSSEVLQDDISESNTVKLFTEKEMNTESKVIDAKKKTSGRQWFF